tara:strand:- start:15586 stop:16527 length:942 start_codon:yes stop_codon:yes gene_type:complete
MAEINYEKMQNKDGSINEKYVDVLDEDKLISGQKFTCISFISPENIIRQKNMYLFDEFLKQWDMHKSMEKFTQFLNFISYKYKLDFDKVMVELDEFCKEEKDKLFLTTLDDDYKSYIDNHGDKLEEEFNKKYKFQTSVRGIKNRGNFPSQEEAELRAKMLRENDPNHDVYVGPVGMWMPFHPEAYKTGRVEHLEEELNQLMQEKIKNEKAAKEEFDKRVKESKQKAIADNIIKAKESGNVLTQTINDNGDLINITNMNTTENVLSSSNTSIVSSNDVRKELFEGDNIVTDKNSDHGLSELMENKSNHEDEDED